VTVPLAGATVVAKVSRSVLGSVGWMIPVTTPVTNGASR